MTTEEGNKIIAAFMGVKIGEDKYSWRIGCSEPLREEHLAYHTAWGWLMPVVEKVGDTRMKSTASYNPDLIFRIEIVNGYTKIEGTGHRIFANSSIEGSMLTATWKCVVQWVEWYNTQQKAQGSVASKDDSNSKAD